MYEAIRLFTDLQDNDYEYKVGDTYPREGLEVTDERIRELLGSHNKQGTPVIREKPQKRFFDEAGRKK